MSAEKWKRLAEEMEHQRDEARNERRTALDDLGESKRELELLKSELHDIYEALHVAQSGLMGVNGDVPAAVVGYARAAWHMSRDIENKARSRDPRTEEKYVGGNVVSIQRFGW